MSFRNGTPILLVPLLVAGCGFPRPLLDDTHRTPYPANFPALPAGTSLDVLVLGDWGTGGPGQRQVAQAVEDAFRDDPPELVLTVGDNFYPSGVASTDDPLWRRIFGKVYTGPFWDSLVFHPTLGNHDRYGNPLAQIQYSAINPRWQMPAFHYAFRKSLPDGGSVLFLALDTEPLQGARERSDEQLAWMDSVLTGSPDRWVVAYGHHPLASAGWYDADEPFRKRVIPVLAGRAVLYLAGHNHSLEFLPASPDLLQAVCGGGAGRDNPYRVRTEHRALSAFTNGGWCYLRIFYQALVVELYNREGSLRYRYLIPSSEDPVFPR